MKYSITSKKSVSEVVDCIKEIAKTKDFSVSNVMDMHDALSQRGVFFASECQVLDISNPHNALNLLSTSMDMSMILPCKIYVYDQDGKTIISMSKDVQLYRKHTHDLDEIAIKTESEMVSIVKQSA